MHVRNKEKEPAHDGDGAIDWHNDVYSNGANGIAIEAQRVDWSDEHTTVTRLLLCSRAFASAEARAVERRTERPHGDLCLSSGQWRTNAVLGAMSLEAPVAGGKVSAANWSLSNGTTRGQLDESAVAVATAIQPSSTCCSQPE